MPQVAISPITIKKVQIKSTSNKKHMARRRQFVCGGGEPADEPKSQTGTLRSAADCLRLLRSLRQRPQFGTSSAVGAVLRVGMLMADAEIPSDR